MFPLECSKKKKCRLCVNPGNDLSQIILLSCQEKVNSQLHPAENVLPWFVKFYLALELWKFIALGKIRAKLTIISKQMDILIQILGTALASVMLVSKLGS